MIKDWDVKDEIVGGLAVLASTLCFYLCTVVVRLGEGQVVLSSSYYAFSRFFLGFLITSSSFALRRSFPHPKEYRYLILRALGNLCSVFCFYKAVVLTSAAEANILNMTYPVFIVLFSLLLFREVNKRSDYVLSILAFLGILLVVNPLNLQRTYLQSWGLVSGVSGALAVIALNKTRQKNDTETVLFFMFGIATVILYAIDYNEFPLPTKEQLLFLSTSAFLGVLGQYFLTFGQRYISPMEGGVISASRILLAAFLSPLLIGEPPLSVPGWVGAFVIFACNLYVAYKRVASD